MLGLSLVWIALTGVKNRRHLYGPDKKVIQSDHDDDDDDDNYDEYGDDNDNVDNCNFLYKQLNFPKEYLCRQHFSNLD